MARLGHDAGPSAPAQDSRSPPQTVFAGLVPAIHTAHDDTMDRVSFVYLMASKKYGTLYCGVTSDLVRRVWEHREDIRPGFTSRYGIKMLVWYETFGDILLAIQREKTIKKYPRQWKINLIEASNPHWIDLWPEISTNLPRPL